MEDNGPRHRQAPPVVAGLKGGRKDKPSSAFVAAKPIAEGKILASVAAGGHALSAPQTSEHDLDPVAGLVSVLPGGNSHHTFGLRKAARQNFSTCVVTDLTCGLLP